jgi:multiple sugar transport system substrate-binding protein
MSARGLLARILVIVVVMSGAWWMFGDLAGLTLGEQRRPLRLSFWGRFEEYDMWKEVTAAFEEHSGISVKLEYIPTRYEAKIQQLIVAGDPPDVILFQDEPFPRFVASGRIEDLTPYLDRPGFEIDLDTFYSTAVQAFGVRKRIDGQSRPRQYGIPIWGGCNLLYYNESLFQAAKIAVGTNPPGQGLVERDDGWWVIDDEQWTIGQWHRVARRLTRDVNGDGRIDQFGFMLPAANYYLPWIWSMDGAVLNEDFTHSVFYGDAVEKALRLYQDLRWGEDPASPQISEMASVTTAVGFFTGRIAMYCSGPWELPFLTATDLECDLLHIPRGAGGYRATRITWDCLMIPTQSTRKDDGWQFIHFAATRPGQRFMASAQRSIAARTDMAERFIRTSPHIEVRKFILAANDYAKMQPITKQWDLMYRVLTATMMAMQRENPADRLTPAEAIGRFYAGYAANDADSAQLMEVLPPADPQMAEHYREIFIESGKLP